MSIGPDDERRQSDEPPLADVMNGFSLDSRHERDGYEEQYPDYEAPERRFWTRKPSGPRPPSPYPAHAEAGPTWDASSATQFHETDWLTGHAPTGGTVQRPDGDSPQSDFLAGMPSIDTPRHRPLRAPRKVSEVLRHYNPQTDAPEEPEQPQGQTFQPAGPRPSADPLPVSRALPDSAPTAPIDLRGVGEVGDLEDVSSGASFVRPYAWTRGRTRSGLDLAIEALVSTSRQGRSQLELLQMEHRAIAELCEEPRSVAEVAALMSLPLGVARVLLGDMAGLGVVTVHQTASSTGSSPDLALMERVLSGLRRL
ncbi:hypothetical protein PSU4_15350 [Pseudonocardia sulfidoxydans NBRC 16205]|uniref:DUF742 domain-containing protein n=1 Tax=Pseudonocardia sulfidoxydans NBRC 16205 TaxID=1223511 RepID=A0A511DCQ8_9PSEU|nr:DUF742 domain-containing protein [Pseudonocardia sulfidoxydans]GEL22581.1 hypothetical protein PSU4_15350 [Pseudonocardia sulfidoxydans NBRC 16205]